MPQTGSVVGPAAIGLPYLRARAGTTRAGTQHASVARMRITTALILIGVLGVGSALAARRPSSDETTGATNLLTAERRARDAADRLRLPAAGPSRWKSGGHGWAPARARETPPPRQPARD
jgi:hypothetical protein